MNGVVAASDGAISWPDLTDEQKNTLIGELIGAKPMRNIWLQWMPKNKDGSLLCKKNLGQLGDMSMEDAEEWLKSSKKSKAEWVRRNINLDWMLREEVNLTEQLWHINYSNTPGGGWIVVEALRKSFDVLIRSIGEEWRIDCGLGNDSFAVKSQTMADAACQMALLLLGKNREWRPA